ncbi:MAG: ATP-binding cassette domain-containing protein [Oscillospiraceae bacterium]|nr:ATP-binding cassette domain-containing protein [Oscillospiraceae bacterium]
MLEITNVTKTFLKGTPDEQTALDDLTLSLSDGEFITIVGSNGAGKSTLFNAIGGTFMPDRGRIVLNSKDITYMPEHRRAHLVGRLFQDPMKGTAPDLTIEENLALAYNRKSGGALRRAVGKKETELFHSALAGLDMGLEERMKTKVGLLSGGQRQAVTLLMATLGRPALLLLDEHTAALDPAAAEKIMRLTSDITAKEGLSVMMITHNVRSALKTGTRTVMMDAGRIILDISGKEREEMTVPRLMELYSRKSGGLQPDTDRMLFTKQ